MLLHNPECTHGGPHAYSACRDPWNQPLAMIEVPDPTPAEPDADIEAAARAFGGLVADLSAHDPKADPDADADAAQRVADAL